MSGLVCIHNALSEVEFSQTGELVRALAIATRARSDRHALLASCRALRRELGGAFDQAGNPYSDPVHGEPKAMREASALIARLEKEDL